MDLDGIRPARRKEMRKRDALRLHAEGLTYRAIALRLGLTPEWVSQLCREGGIPRRKYERRGAA